MAARPTPYSIALAALIAIHCEENSPLYDDKTSSHNKDALFAAVDAFVQQCLLTHSNKQHSWTQTADASIASLLRRLSLHQKQQHQLAVPAVARNVWEWLRIAASNIDAFVDLMLSIHMALQTGSVDVESANGIFLRSITLGYHQLSFEASVELFKAFAVEVRQAEGSLVSHERDDRQMEEGEEQQQRHNWTLSAAQREESLRDECLLSGVTPSAVAGAVSQSTSSSLSDDQMSYHLKQILSLNPELPSGHFLRFLHCLRTGERVGAMEALHEYVDYYFANIAAGNAVADGGHHNGEILQFAAILKAALHQATGDPRLSRAATEEAVRVAQQSHDTSCVAFALGWLSVHHSIATGIANTATVDTTKQAQELMERCVQRATEGNLRILAAGANLSLAIGALQTAAPQQHQQQQDPASRAWKYWNDAAADPPTADASNTLDRPTHMMNLASGEDAARIMARQQLVAAGIWETLGKNALARLASTTALQCHFKNMTVQDRKVAIQNISRSTLFGSGPTIAPTTIASSSDESSTSVPSCAYGAALKALLSLNRAMDLEYDSDTTLGMSLLLHEWAVRRGEYDHATTLMVSLQSQLHPRTPAFEDLCIDIASQKALLLSRQGHLEEAISKLREAISKCRAMNKHTRVSELLLQLARIHAESDRFTNALAPLTECMDLCQKHEQDTLHAASLALFAHLHLLMGNHRRALGIIRAVLPSLLENGHITWQAGAYLTLSKSHLGMAKSGNNATSSLNSAISSLQKCEDLFLKCQDCLRLKEVYYLLAHSCDASPVHKHRRDKYAQAFLDMKNLQLTGGNTKTEEFMSLLSKPDGMVELASRALPLLPIA